MPRNAKRMQAPAAPQDQGYGVRGEQIAAQNQMGIPDNASAPPPAGGGGGDLASLLAGVAPPAGPQDPQALLQTLTSEAPPPAGGLARPSERPDEALMQGVQNPGGTSSRNIAAEALEAMAEATGDARIAAMAERARMV